MYSVTVKEAIEMWQHQARVEADMEEIKNDKFGVELFFTTFKIAAIAADVYEYNIGELEDFAFSFNLKEYTLVVSHDIISITNNKHKVTCRYCDNWYDFVRYM